jgi:hypothetical protein
VSSKQGQVITFADGSRVVFRLSGTGSQGATVRMYVERYVPPTAGPAELARNAADGLKGLIEVALELSKLKQFLGREEPTVITVSSLPNKIPPCLTSIFSKQYENRENVKWAEIRKRLMTDICTCDFATIAFLRVIVRLVVLMLEKDRPSIE